MKALIIMLSGLSIVANAIAADVESAYVGKGRTYAQTNAGPSVLRLSPYVFEIAVRTTDIDTLNSAAWSQPPFPPPAFRFIPFPTLKTPLLFTSIDRWSSQSVADGAHPNGDYYILLNTEHDGERTNRILLSGSTYPAPPQIANYAAAQNIDAASDFTLQWNQFPGGGASDLITLTVMEAAIGTGIVFQTPLIPGAISALDGTRTSVSLPASTLAPGRAYLGRLRFEKITSTDRTNYPSELGFAAYFASTDFYLSTLGADSNTAPRIQAVYPPSGATGVPLDAPLIWTFSKPMQRASSLSLGGFATNRTSFWTTDRRSFVFLPLSLTAPDTNVTWRLQPWQPWVLFGDLLGNPLFTDLGGDFQTGEDLLPSPPQPQLGTPTVVSNTVEFLLHGESNRLYAVQFSTNLSNWTFFSTNVTLMGPSLVTHPAVSSAPQRFYRATVLR